MLVHVFVCGTSSLLSGGGGGFVETIAVHVILHLRSQQHLWSLCDQEIIGLWVGFTDL